MREFNIITILLVTLLMTSCASQKKETEAPPQPTEYAMAEDVRQPAGSNYYIPQAVIYQTNGDYDKHVMVNLNDSRTTIVSYPAISDVTADSTPINLGNGWLLDRRGGISTNSAFLTYTYAEYAALKKQPTVKELFSKIIPEARVTRCMALPINVNQALADPEAVKKYLPAE